VKELGPSGDSPSKPDPRAARWFLLDLCGASASALLSGVVLPGYADRLGVASATLQRLTVVAVGLAGMDAACLALRPRRWRSMLRGVALANLTYPLFAAAVVAVDGVPIGPLGAALLGGESLVVVVLGAAQLRAAREHST
jgi:hypothetical protein